MFAKLTGYAAQATEDVLLGSEKRAAAFTSGNSSTNVGPMGTGVLAVLTNCPPMAALFATETYRSNVVS